jgi:1-aminocyclopropane-1-carboxylate deaminase/D-cysteine desulfhydrase-like pyridoxal-dependent ACC family enzyme
MVFYQEVPSDRVGLTLGLDHLHLLTRAIGIYVQTKTPFLSPLIAHRANEAAARLGLGITITEDDFEHDDRWIDLGYGIASAAGIEAMDRAARTQRLMPGRVYTSKSMAGLIAHRAGRWSAGETIVFLHSGGTPRLFEYGAEGLAAARGLPA